MQPTDLEELKKDKVRQIPPVNPFEWSFPKSTKVQITLEEKIS